MTIIILIITYVLMTVMMMIMMTEMIINDFDDDYIDIDEDNNKNIDIKVSLYDAVINGNDCDD